MHLKKILYKDIRFANETIYAYIDKEDLMKRFKSVNLSEKVSGVWKNFEKFGGLNSKGLYYFNRYTQEFYVDITAKDNYYIASDDDALIEISTDASVTFEKKWDETTYRCKIQLNSINVPAGSILKLTGGKITPYDTTYFAGKSLTLAECSPNATAVSSASIVVCDDPVDGKTFKLTIDGNEWAGTWKAVSAAVEYNEPRQRIELEVISGSDSNVPLDSHPSLIFFDSHLNNTPGPLWVFEAGSPSNYSFILTEKK